jgi:hypothetical protein
MTRCSRIGTAGALVAFSWVMLAQPVLACPVCFGASDTPAVQGAKMAIIALLGVTGSVLGAFGAFFVYLMRRARMIAGAPADAPQPGARERSG